MCLTADQGVVSSIPAQYHTFVEIDHEIIYTAILHEIIYTAILLVSSDLRRVVVSNKRKYVHKVLVACLGKKCG